MRHPYLPGYLDLGTVMGLQDSSDFARGGLLQLLQRDNFRGSFHSNVDYTELPPGSQDRFTALPLND